MKFKSKKMASMDMDKPEAKSLSTAYAMKRQNAPMKMAKGGMVDDSAEHYSSIADAILAKKRERFDNSDLQNNSHELPNFMDTLDEAAVIEPLYDDEMSAFPEEESSKSVDVESDTNDRIGNMRKRMRAKGK